MSSTGQSDAGGYNHQEEKEVLLYFGLILGSIMCICFGIVWYKEKRRFAAAEARRSFPNNHNEGEYDSCAKTQPCANTQTLVLQIVSLGGLDVESDGAAGCHI